MKCKDCIACKERYIFNGSKIFGHTELKHYCTGVKEPFEIQDINKECTEYPDKREATSPKEEKQVIGKLVLGDRLYVEYPCGKRYYLEDVIKNGILNDLKNK